MKNYNDITTRKIEISFIENLLYKFLYSVPKTTKTEITSSFNFENNTFLSRQTFDYRENTVPFRF